MSYVPTQGGLGPKRENEYVAIRGPFGYLGKMPVEACGTASLVTPRAGRTEQVFAGVREMESITGPLYQTVRIFNRL